MIDEIMSRSQGRADPVADEEPAVTAKLARLHALNSSLTKAADDLLRISNRLHGTPPGAAGTGERAATPTRCGLIGQLEDIADSYDEQLQRVHSLAAVIGGIV